jgi:class 3 adenylate cyclase
MTEKEQALSLRRLRFPGELERAFHKDYFEKSIGHTRSTFLILTLIMLAFGAQYVRQPNAAFLFLLWYGGVVPPIAFLTLWSFHPSFQRVMQPVIASVCLIIAFALMIQWLPVMRSTDDMTRTKGFFTYIIAFCLLIGMNYTMMKLRFLAATVVCWTILLVHQVVGFTVYRLPVPGMMFSNMCLGMASVFGMFACLSMERYVRSAFLSHHLLEAERQKSESLLLNILPAPIAERLKTQPGTVADSFAQVTVLFADIVDFTPLSARLPPEQVVDLLNTVFSAFDRLAERHDLEKIKTIGDSYMVVGGLPTPREDHAEAMAEMALEMQEEIRRLSEETGQPLRLRIGINMGPVVAGVIGTKKFSYDLWGDTVNMASRMEAHGLEDRIQVTESTYLQLREQCEFDERGMIPVKGHEEVAAYLLRGRRKSYCASDR